MSRRVNRQPPGQVGQITDVAAASPGEADARGSRGPTLASPLGASAGAGQNECQPYDRLRVAAVGLLLATAIVAVFWRVGRFDFINLDDPGYFSANPHVLGGLEWSNLLWAFGTDAMGNWHPLTWVSLMVDAALFGPGSVGPHLMNLFYHTVNALLLFMLLRRMTGELWRSAVVAALFALHPLRVESVAWVAERKDVLSGLFFLVTLWAYVHYTERKREREECRLSRAEPRMTNDAAGPTFHVSRFMLRAPVYYALALLFFILGLMSKPMLVTLPFVLLLLDYWPLGRFQPNTGNPLRKTFLFLLLEKVPFFLLSGLSCVVTYEVQNRGGAVADWVSLPLTARLQNAPVSYARYLGKTVWPVDLAVIYPHPLHWPWLLVAAATVLVVGLGVAALWYRRRWPYLAVGWLWWSGMLLPVIGLAQAGDQAMADRYTYLPAIGLLVGVVWGVGDWARAWHVSRAAIGVGAAILVMACCLRTVDQLRHWQTSETLFRYALACTSDNFVAHDSLGLALAAQGKMALAIQHFEQALRIRPGFYEAHVNLGLALAAQAKWAEAIAHYEKALAVRPGALPPRNDLAWLLATCPQPEFRNGARAVALAGELNQLTGGNDRDALDTLAAAYAEAGQFPQAVEAAQRAIALAVAQTNSQMEQFRARLKLYREGSPYHEPPPGAAPQP